MQSNLASFDNELEELRHSNWQAAIKNDRPQKSCEPVAFATFADQWKEKDRLLIEWFLSCSSLPLEPFKFKPGINICDTQKFYASLREDIACGPKGIRTRYGALQIDLSRLRGITETLNNITKESKK